MARLSPIRNPKRDAVPALKLTLNVPWCLSQKPRKWQRIMKVRRRTSGERRGGERRKEFLLLNYIKLRITAGLFTVARSPTLSSRGRSFYYSLSLSLSVIPEDSKELQLPARGNCGKSLSLQLRTVLFRHHVETYRSLLLAFRRKPETVIRPDVAGITRPFGARRMRAIENCR